MGLFKISSSVLEKLREQRAINNYINLHVKLPNPDPRNYVIKDFQQVGKYLVVLIHYPDCTNFEGKKILVFKNITIKKLRCQGIIDPHFFPDHKICSPIARFVPTPDGWQMAIRMCKNETKCSQ